MQRETCCPRLHTIAILAHPGSEHYGANLAAQNCHVRPDVLQQPIRVHLVRQCAELVALLIACNINSESVYYISTCSVRFVVTDVIDVFRPHHLLHATNLPVVDTFANIAEVTFAANAR